MSAELQVTNPGTEYNLSNDSFASAAIQAATEKLEKIQNGGGDKNYEPDYNESQEEAEKAYHNKAEKPQDVEESEKSTEEEEIAKQEEEEESEPDDSREEVAPSKRTWDAKKERYQLKAALTAKEEEIASLRELLKTSNHISTEQYSKLVENEVEKATEAMEKAIAEDDRKAYINAQKELIKAQYKEQKMHEWFEQEKLEAQQTITKPQEQPAQQNPYVEVIGEWQEYIHDNHPELIKTSKYYNEELYSKVDGMMKSYDRQLAREGYADMIGSPDYLSEVSKQIEHMQSEFRKSRQQTKKAPIPSPVSAVRQGSADGLRGVGATKKVSSKATELSSEIEEVLSNFSNTKWMQSEKDKNQFKQMWAKGLST